MSWTEYGTHEPDLAVFDFCPICEELPGYCKCRRSPLPPSPQAQSADCEPPPDAGEDYYTGAPPVGTDRHDVPQSPARPTAVTAAGIAGQYQPIDWHDLWARTSSEPDWLVPGIIERGRLHAIYAPKKHKKSLLTLVMVASLVTGRPLLGRPNPHGRPVRVLYIDIENSRDDIRQRLHDAGYGPGDLTDLPYYSFPSLPGLDSAAGGVHLLALIDRHQPELVVLDTTSRVVTGKENDADTFRSLYRYTLAPIKALGIAVLRLDNAGKDPTLGQRGSSAKGDDLDTAWLVTMQGDDRITLRLDFQRSNHHPQQIELVRSLDPLRFVRLDSAADRPEITALIGHLDRLNVPLDAGRPKAQHALTAAGIGVRASALAEAIKIRKSCSQDHGTGVPEDDQIEINFTCSGPNTAHLDTPGQSCSEQSGNSGNSSTPPKTDRAVPDLGVTDKEHPKGNSSGRATPKPSEDPQICPRCNNPTDRFVPPDGLCETCAYPAGGAPGDHDHDDDIEESHLTTTTDTETEIPMISIAGMSPAVRAVERGFVATCADYYGGRLHGLLSPAGLHELWRDDNGRGIDADTAGRIPHYRLHIDGSVLHYVHSSVVPLPGNEPTE